MFKKYKKIMVLLFLTVTVNNLSAQNNIKKYVKENYVKINSISPDATDYADLKELGDAIGNSNVVMLGEQDHGDAATFLAKTRIIKYLHEKKGFNVLAFESDFFGLNYGWDNLNNNKQNLDSLIMKNIYPIWTYCDACSNLFKTYLPQTLLTSSPLKITGFDNQNYSKLIFEKLDSVIISTSIPIGKLPQYSTEVLSLFKSWYKNIGDTLLIKKTNNYLSELKNQLYAKLGDGNFWSIAVENLIQQNLQFVFSKTDPVQSTNIRDRQMAKNLQWVVNTKYPKDKIIVWAHNHHISKYNGHFREDFLNNVTTMGAVFTSDTVAATNSYILGFTSLKGSTARLKQKVYSVSKPKKNSFEKWIGHNVNYAFVDFHIYNNSNYSIEDFYMSGAFMNKWYHKSHLAKWSEIFDGVFYIKEMFPCKEIK